MNSSRLSESSGRGRAERGFHSRIAKCGALLGVIVLASCKDNIAPPTLGRVEIRLTSPTAGGFDGTKIFLGDSLFIASVDRDRYEVSLPAGTHTLHAEKECCTALPEAARQFQIEPGRVTSLSWQIVPGQAIEVVSNMRHAKIRLDGADTGRTTPATLTCVTPGMHQVSVSLVGATAGADSMKAVEVGEASVQVSFDLSPVPQARVALMEIFTSTQCPFCETADAAAESLWARVGPSGGYIGVQVHTYWSGGDSLATPSSLARDALYGDMQDHGLPASVVAGTVFIRGIPSNAPLESVVSMFRERLDPIRTSESAVAIHWLSADRLPGERVTARARIFCLRDLPGADELEIVALTYKDGLVTRGIRGIDSFRHVVRDYQVLGNSDEMALNQRGDWADVEMTFDLGGDRRVGGALWDESRMGLVLFLQNSRSREILQAGHTPLP